MAIELIDHLVVAAYLVVIVGIGVYFMRREQNTAQDYFLASKKTHWFVVGCSFFASNIGSDSIIGLSGAGAAFGIAASTFDWGSAFFFVLLGWVFAPFFLKTGIFTMPEYLEVRFDGRLRTYLSAISLVGFVIVQYALTIYSAVIVLQTVLEWEKWTSLISIVSITAFYTFTGGLKAVVYTEVLQTGLLLIGTAFTCIVTMGQVGGIPELREVLPDKRMFHMFRNDADTPYPIAGILFGAPWLIGWYHCCNQDMVQRALAAKDERHAKAGCVMAGWLKLLPPFLFCMPGMAAHALFPRDLGCEDIRMDGGGFRSVCAHPDTAFPVLVNRLLPAGARGLVLAAVLAAMMSTLASAFNSSSTLFTMDIYCRYRPSATPKELVQVGRICTLVLAVLSVLWVPMIGRLGETVYVYAQMANACLAPPIFALFLLSLLVPSMNSTGGIAGMALGHFLGLLRLFLCVMRGGCERSAFSPVLLERMYLGSNFLYFACFEGLAAALCMVVVSRLTGGLTDQHLQRVQGLTWASRNKEQPARPQHDVRADEGEEEGGIMGADPDGVRIEMTPQKGGAGGGEKVGENPEGGEEGGNGKEGGEGEEGAHNGPQTPGGGGDRDGDALEIGKGADFGEEMGELGGLEERHLQLFDRVVKGGAVGLIVVTFSLFCGYA